MQSGITRVSPLPFQLSPPAQPTRPIHFHLPVCVCKRVKVQSSEQKKKPTPESGDSSQNRTRRGDRSGNETLHGMPVSSSLQPTPAVSGLPRIEASSQADSVLFPHWQGKRIHTYEVHTYITT